MSQLNNRLTAQSRQVLLWNKSYSKGPSKDDLRKELAEAAANTARLSEATNEKAGRGK